MRAKGQAQLQDGRPLVRLTRDWQARSDLRRPPKDGVYWRQVGEPTWVTLEQPYPSSFRKHAAVSAQPSVWWRLPVQLVAGVPIPPSCA